jgi:hypothetical protein
MVSGEDGHEDEDDREARESLPAIQRALEQAKRGEGRPMREFLEELAAEHGIELR